MPQCAAACIHFNRKHTMPKFVIISGTLLVPAPVDKDGKPIGGKKQISKSFGDEVEMSAADHHAVDPKGERLISPEAYSELKKSADAHRAFLAKQKELGASLVELSPKLLASFAKLEVEKRAPESKPTKPEAPKGGK